MEFCFENAQKAKNAHSALLCEQEEKKRCKITLGQTGKKVIVDIIAQDLVALRACANSIMRLAQTINNVDKVI